MLRPSVLDAPQTTPPPEPPRRTPEWYERQQTATFSSRIVPEMHRGGWSRLSQGKSYDQIPPKRDVNAQLRTLRQHYTVLGSDRRVIEVLEQEAAVFTLLIEAVQPLRVAFGEGGLLQVRVQYSDDDSLLRVVVQLPIDFGCDPESALRSFDREWWLNNCHRSGGMIVFDYEIRDAL
jgi:hypothetical protein